MQSFRRRGTAHLLVRALEFLAWTVFFAFAATFLALRFWLLPQVDRYHDEVVAALSRAVGLPVTIGGLSAEWDGLHPQLTVTDLRVLDHGGREVLVLPLVEPVVGWGTLLAGELRLHSLAIDGPRLTVRRAADGTLSVAGVALAAKGGGSGGGSSRLADWILDQREIIVRNAEIEWIDDLRGAPPLTLHNLQFRLRNRGEVHQIGLSARPPRELGAGLEVRASLLGHGSARPSAWSGRVYVELGYTDLAGWRPWLDYPVEVASGQGAVRMWMTFGAGRLVDATLDLALARVAARLGADLPELRLTRLSGRVQGRALGHGYEFGARRLELVPEQGAPMTGTTFRVSWEGTPPEKGTLSADSLELAPLAALARYLPLRPEVRARLEELAPQGRLTEASIDWSGKLPDEARYRGRARFEGLTMNAWRAVPGIVNLSGRIDASESRGTLMLASHNAQVLLPKVFPEPRLAFTQLAAEAIWERRADGRVSVRIADLRFANEDVAGTASGTYAFTEGEGPGTIDLSAQLQRADARALDRYLPRPEIIGEHARAWVVRAIRAGESIDTRLRVRGDLRDFPFLDPQQGQFRIVAQVRGAELDYAPGWPALHEIDGELTFERASMSVVVRQAHVLGATIDEARAVIARLHSSAVLEITGRAQGPTSEFLKFIRDSPVQRAVGGLASGVHATGAGQLDLKLSIPLADTQRTGVKGEFRFSGNTLRLGAPLPPIERAAATIAFTDSSVQVRNATARFVGGPLRVLGGTQKGGGVVLSAAGAFTVDAIESFLPEAWRGLLSGGAPYAGSIRIARDGPPQLAVETSLKGVESSLPPPLDKSADETQLLRIALMQGGDGGHDRVSVSLGQLLRAEFLRRREQGEQTLERATVAFNPPPGVRLRFPERPARVLFYGSLAHLDLDRWLALLPGGSGGGGGVVAEMSFGKLEAFGRRFEDLSVKAKADADGWTASLDSKRIAGDVVYRAGGPVASLQARMARFDVPQETPAAAPGRKSRELPDVDLVADDFGYHDRRFGRVEIVAHHDGPDWRIERLSMTNPDGKVAGKGVWRTGPEQSTRLDLDLQASDVGGLLARVGYPKLVEHGRAKASATLQWAGEPTDLDFGNLSGKVQLQAEDGRFLEINSGFGKFISLVSLQNLPKRVMFDFGDVFSKGFQWDSIEATARIDQGVMHTDDFTMSGGAAEVQMRGSVDLARETQDVNVKVVPGLDGTAATAAGVLVNPVIGLTSLIVQKALRNPLGQIFAYRYEITGDWAAPKVEKLKPAPVVLPTPPVGD
ncbi:MAG: YhdP family protein [Burkholderiales bacterium]